MPAKRLYIKGLSGSVSGLEIEEKFKSFGNAYDASVALDSFGSCRGFGHVTLDCDTSGINRCLTSLNGSLWKGNRIRIEDARPAFSPVIEQSVSSPPSTKSRRLVRHASDMSLVDEKNVDGKRGWRRGKFGRPIAILKLRKLDGTLMVMDPSHDISALEKYYEGFRPRAVHHLTWFEEGQDLESGEVKLEEHVYNSRQFETCHDSVKSAYQETYQTGVNAWEQISGGQLFSLSSILSLPSIKNEHQLCETSNTVSEKSPSQSNHDVLNFAHMFLDMRSLPAVRSFRHWVEGESNFSAWKVERSIIRQDFKKQLKAARRKSRKQLLLRV